MGKVAHFEGEILRTKAAVATSMSAPWMRSLVIVRASPLGINNEADIWARTSATNRDTQSLVSAVKADLPSSILEGIVDVKGLLR